MSNSCDPLYCSPTGSSVHGILWQECWSGLPFPSPGIFPTQESNPGLLHCRQILSRLSYERKRGVIKQPTDGRIGAKRRTYMIKSRTGLFQSQSCLWIMNLFRIQLSSVSTVQGKIKVHKKLGIQCPFMDPHVHESLSQIY